MARRWAAAALVCVCALLLACGGAEVTSYILNWNTSAPIKPETMHISVVGGEVYSSTMNRNQTIGSIEVVAPVECVFITWTAETKDGGETGARYFWNRACPYALYLPLAWH